MKRISRLVMAAAALALLVAAPQAQAQTKYPTKPIRIIVPYAPGGTTDVVARLVADQARQILGQAVVVENKPGASGIIAIEETARAKPDGYTVMIGNISTNALTPILMQKRMKIDYDKSLQVVARLANLPLMFVVATKDFPPSTLAEFVAYAKANPGKVRYASAGFGAFQQIDMEHFAKRAGLQLVHIPNKSGGSGMMRDIGNGDVHATWFSTMNGGTLIRQGRARGLAVAMEQRHPDYPDMPTMAEAGYPGVGGGQWQAAFVPTGTPPDIIETLNKTFQQALTAPPVQAAYKKGDIVAPAQHSPAEAQAWIAKEMDGWRKLIAELNIAMDE
jgi:tripartite-type tricarboxylate transporter receptor subunit TctC